MNFTRTTSYSLHVLSYMARNESVRMSASYLHRKLKIPYAYLRSILGNLSRNGLINGQNGRNGGFILSRDKSAIYLSNIIEATEGLDSINKCIMGFSKCPFNYGCFMHPVWTKMRAEIIHTLKKTSLADLIIGKDQ